ncbi:MAG: tail fiber protein, partial [Thermodesulfovibrionales bacterium]
MDKLHWSYRRFIVVLILLFAGLSILPVDAEAQPYIGEIRWVAFNFAPAGWAFCDGSLLPIAENDTLFALIGTTYGGDGQTTFALPDLRGRTPIHTGTGTGLTNRELGEMGGAETRTLSISQLPPHNHLVNAGPTTGSSASPSNAYPARSQADDPGYNAASTNQILSAGAVTSTGGGQAFEIMQPFQVLNCIISLFGIF